MSKRGTTSESLKRKSISSSRSSRVGTSNLREHFDNLSIKINPDFRQNTARSNQRGNKKFNYSPAKYELKNANKITTVLNIPVPHSQRNTAAFASYQKFSLELANVSRQF